MSADASVLEELARLRASEARLIAFAEGARRLLDVTDPKALVDEVLALAQQSVAADGYAVWRQEEDTWRVAATSGMDALISDIAMPDRDGFWLIEQVRRQPRDRGGEVPAIALSAFADVNTRMRASSAGFSAHLSKPVRADTLVSEVARVLQRQ